jgi:hypothetical protein
MAGFALLDVLLGVGLLLIFIAGIVVLVVQVEGQIQANDTAYVLDLDSTYAEKYLNNYSSLIATALSPGGAAYAIPLGTYSTISPAPTLLPGLTTPQLAGLTPSGFQDHDSFGQSHVILIRELSDGSYQAILMSVGGSAIPQKILGDIVRKGGSIAGGIGFSTDAASNSEIAGAFGTWTIPKSDFKPSNASVSLTKGHYASLLDFIPAPAAPALSTYLNRFATGNPEANTMNTNIIDSDKDIKGVDEVNFNTGAEMTEDTAGNNEISASNVSTQGTLNVRGNQTVSSSTTAAQQTIGGNETVLGQLSIAGNSSAAAIDYQPAAQEGTSCTVRGAVVAESNGSGQLIGCEGTSGSAVWTSLGTGSGGTGEFSTYFNVGCASSVSWTNSYQAPAVVTMQLNGEGQDGSMSYRITDSAGNAINETVFDGYGEALYWLQGQQAIVPKGATITASSSGTQTPAVCMSGFHS